MKAVIFNQYGDANVLEIADIPQPALQPQTVLIKVHATAINPKDTFIRKGRFKRFTGSQFPQGTGFDFAGEVVGSAVNNYQLGDHVFGMLEGWHGGSCAEYLLAKPNQLAKIPASLSYPHATALPLVTLTALQALRDNAKLHLNMRVCINGASGGVGTMAVQIAKLYDCHVTAISSQKNHAFLTQLGADTCLDYRENDIRKVSDIFDIFFDVFGNTRFRDIQPILSTHGTWVSTVLRSHVFISQFLSRFSSKTATLVVVKANHDDLERISTWVAEEKLKPVIHDIYSLERIADAHRQQESKHTRGKLVIEL